MDDPLATAFALASRFLVEAVRLVPYEDWESPGLGIWSVRELVGHANRGQTTVEDYLLRPQPPRPEEADISARRRSQRVDARRCWHSARIRQRASLRPPTP